MGRKSWAKKIRKNKVLIWIKAEVGATKIPALKSEHHQKAWLKTEQKTL